MFDFIVGLLCGAVLTLIFEWVLQSNKHLKKHFWDNHKAIFGYHFHHSTYGLLLCVAALFFLFFDESLSYLLLGIGTGIISAHTYTDKRLVFVEKSK